LIAIAIVVLSLSSNWEPTFVPYSEASLTQGLLVYFW